MGNNQSTSYDGGQGNRCGLSKNNPDLTAANSVCQNWQRMYRFIMRNTLPPGPDIKDLKKGEAEFGPSVATYAATGGSIFAEPAMIDAGLALGRYYDNIEYPENWEPMPNCKDNPDLIDGKTCCTYKDCNQKYPPGWNGSSIQYPDSILCPYPDNLFNLWRSDCLDSENGRLQTYFDAPNKDNFLKVFNNINKSVNPEKYWNASPGSPDSDIKCETNPYECVANIVNAVTKEGHDDYGYTCRWLNPKGEYCRTEAFSLTANRRAAAWGCGIGGLIGLSGVGVCNENYNFEGLADWISDIGRIIPEFESLTYLCMGTQISAFQCKILENFATQDVVYKSLIIQKEKLLQEKLEQPIIVTTITLILVMIILIFLSSIKIYT